MRQLRRAWILGLVALAAVLASAVAVAWTSPDLAPEVSVTLTDPSGSVAVPVTVEDIYPGANATHRYVLALDTYSLSAHPALVVEDVVDLEQGCNRPEQSAGDDSCGTANDDGELSLQLRLAVAVTRAATGSAGLTCPTSPIWAVVSSSRSLVSYEGAPVNLAPSALLAGEGLCIELRLELPAAADNLVQTDMARFTLRFVAEQTVVANQEVKRLAISRLEDALPTGDKTLDQVIPKAITRIQQSLAPDLWIDDTHLTESGKHVYDRERQAAHELLKPYERNEAVADVEGWLVGVDARISAVSIAEAEDALGDATAALAGAPPKARKSATTTITQATTELTRARQAMDAGDASAAIGAYDTAITRFREARERAVRARSLALGALATLR